MNPKEQTEVERLRLENAALRAQLKPQFAATHYGMMPVSIASMERLSASITGLTKRLALTEAQTLNVNAMFEFRDAFVAAAQRVPVKRVEYQDDGSLTVVLDYWPQSSKQNAPSMTCGCAGKGFEFCGCPPKGEPQHERQLRRMLAARSGIPHIYMDDGEAQGSEHGITIDFLREPLANIDAKLRALSVARLKLGSAAPPQQAPMTLADVLDALNVFNKATPREDDGKPWGADDFIRVDHLPDLINKIISARGL